MLGSSHGSAARSTVVEIVRFELVRLAKDGRTSAVAVVRRQRLAASLSMAADMVAVDDKEEVR